MSNFLSRLCHGRSHLSHNEFFSIYSGYVTLLIVHSTKALNTRLTLTWWEQLQWHTLWIGIFLRPEQQSKVIVHTYKYNFATSQFMASYPNLIRGLNLIILLTHFKLHSQYFECICNICSKYKFGEGCDSGLIALLMGRMLGQTFAFGTEGRTKHYAHQPLCEVHA